MTASNCRLGNLACRISWHRNFPVGTLATASRTISPDRSMPVIFSGFAASNCFATFPGPQPTSNTSASGARSLASSWNMRHIRRIFHELAGIRLRIGVVRLNCCVCFVHAFGSFTHSLIRAYSRESTVRPDVFILSYCRNLLPIQRPTTSTAVWQNCRMQKDFSAISRSN